ncbi:MAG: hypothetical protein IJS13_08665 [Paludibacteraceae bacterium]|nr:hypothetical protein [Paludibacteraceae bacterium]
MVYGTIKLTPTNTPGIVKLGGENGYLDTYNFDLQDGRFGRNIATLLGHAIAGFGISYKIYNYGYGIINAK